MFVKLVVSTKHCHKHVCLSMSFYNSKKRIKLLNTIYTIENTLYTIENTYTIGTQKYFPSQHKELEHGKVSKCSQTVFLHSNLYFKDFNFFFMDERPIIRHWFQLLTKHKIASLGLMPHKSFLK